MTHDLFIIQELSRLNSDIKTSCDALLKGKNNKHLPSKSIFYFNLVALACYVSYFRYIMSEQKKADDFGITEDDVSEIRQDINKFRFELVDILSRNNFDIGKVGGK